MSHIVSVLLVAAGGALGSVGRYAISGVLVPRLFDWRFPVGTFAVNITGCLLIGILAGFAVKQSLFSSEARLFLFTGLAGGFTTFSTFGLETFELLRRDAVLMAGSYVAASVIIGLLALWLGFSLVSGRA